jgi:hypothetical protein
MALTGLIVIVPAANVAAATAAAKVLDPVGGDKTFNVALNASGDEKDAATHYWCCWYLDDAKRAQFQAALASVPGVTYADHEATTPEQVLTAKAIKAVGREPSTKAKTADVQAEEIGPA